MSEPKIIKFTPILSELIKEGKKTTTFRFFDEKELKTGDKIIFATRDGEIVTQFGEGEILEVYEKMLKDLDENDFIGHEEVDDPLSTYRGYYGSNVQLETTLKIIRFRFSPYKNIKS